MIKLRRTLNKRYMISKSSHNKSNITNETNTILSDNLLNNVQQLKTIFHKSFDIVFREFQIGNSHKAMLIFFQEFTNEELMNSNVLNPLLIHREILQNYIDFKLTEVNSFIKNKVILTSQASEGFKIKDIVNQILSGNTVLLIDKIQYALFINLKKQKERSIEEPVVEPTIRGPHDAFTESLYTNISLIRRRLKTSKLKMEEIKLGRLSQTDIVIAYISGIADDSLVEEIRKRLSKIDIDAILESGYIEELIEDNRFSVFSQLGYTERPDRLTSNLLEGCVGIIIDNTPIALIAPQTFFQLMQSAEDYYERYIPSCFIRLIRYMFLGIALTLPSFYISVLMFHQGMIPLALLRTIADSRQGVPFPIVIESLLMEIFFEGLREAGIRLPRVVGQTLSIVGVLIIGESAVRAGLVSSSTVIIVSLTGISSFIIPRYNLSLSIRILRFVIMILAATFGFFGMFIGLVVILLHMTNLHSFGVPYLSPVAPLNLDSLKDTFVRAPWWAMIKRPGFITTRNANRINKH